MPEQNTERVQNLGSNLLVIKSWDKTSESIEKRPGLRELVERIGFTVPVLATVLNKDFPGDATFDAAKNSDGVKIEDVFKEVLVVNGKPLDRLSVIAYPSAAKLDLKEMTQFKAGGEVIWVTRGKAELTYATKIVGGVISKEDLQTVEVEEGDLIISSDVPNNWSQITGNSFSFTYFVGNPGGIQRYQEVPKESVLVK